MVFSSLPIFLDPPNWGQVIGLSNHILFLTFSFVMHKHDELVSFSPFPYHYLRVDPGFFQYELQISG
jgi:hypothetical protein